MDVYSGGGSMLLALSPTAEESIALEKKVQPAVETVLAGFHVQFQPRLPARQHHTIGTTTKNAA